MSQSYPPPYQTGPTTNSTSIISLILSLLGLVGILPVLGSIGGIITGHMARNDIARSGGLQTGEGLAQAGIIIGWIGVLLWVIGICAAILFGFVLPIFGLSVCALFGMLEQAGRGALPLVLPFV